MTDPTPPPEQPMDDATRARIRARIGEAATTEPTDLRRWALPVVAAVAVLAIAMGGAYAAFWPGDGGPVSPAPAIQETTAPADVPSPGPTGPPSDAPSDMPSALLSTAPPSSVSAEDAHDWGPEDIPRTTCQREVRPRGAEQVVSWPTSAGEAGIWVAGDQWALCEQSGRIATAHAARPLGEEQLDKEAFDFSTSTYDWDDQRALTAYVAGGPLVVPHERIRYTFPDGHTEAAQIATDDEGRQWWVMAYLPTDGMMTAPNANRTKWDPVEVEDALSGVVNTYRLDWFRNGCAQVNHGC